MRFGEQTKSWLQRTVMAIGLVALAVGCRNAGPAMSLAPLGASAHPMGQVDLALKVPQKLEAPESKYRIQFIDWNLASEVNLYVTGIGIDGWVQIDLNPSPSSMSRSFTLVGTNKVVNLDNLSMPSGKKRVVRADISGSTISHELWGVVDVPDPVPLPAVATPEVYVLDDYNTPTARVFRDLLATGDQERTKALFATEVQQLVDNLLDTQRTASGPVEVDGNNDGQLRMIHPALLQTYPVTIAIANGRKAVPFGGGTTRVPYTVPSPDAANAGYETDNPDLNPTPIQHATVVIKAIDGNGAAVTKTCLYWVNDIVTKIQTSGTGESVLTDVALGAGRMATVVDTTTGRRASVQIVPDLVDGETRVVTIAMPFSGVQRVVGSYDLKNWRGFGFNGDTVHNSIAYLNNPWQLALQKDDATLTNSGNTIMYFVDRDNARIRSVKLDDPNAMVETVAGASGEVNVSGNTDLAFDANGDLLFTETVPGATPVFRVARVDIDPATGKRAAGGISTFVDMANVTGWTAGVAPGSIAYDKAANKLYVVGAGGGAICEVDMASYPAPGASMLLTASSSGGGIAVAGGMLFYSTTNAVTYDDTSADPPVSVTVDVNTLMRRDLAASTTIVIAGDPGTYTTSNYGISQAFDLGYTIPARAFFQPSAYFDPVVDSSGNLYYMTKAPLSDPTGPWHYFETWNLVRISNVTSGDDTNNPWLVTYMDLRGKMGMDKTRCEYCDGVPPLEEMLNGIAISPTVPAGAMTNDIYCTGLAKYNNPNHSNTVDVHAIYKVRL